MNLGENQKRPDLSQLRAILMAFIEKAEYLRFDNDDITEGLTDLAGLFGEE